MQLTQAGALPWQAAPAPLPAAARGTRRRFSVQRGPQQPVRAAADFASLRSSAADAVAQAQAKLPLLEAAQRTASQAREPAAEAERHWQELHGRLTALQGETVEATKQLRSAVTAAAGGEWEATHALLQVHVKERLEHFRINQGLALATEWKVFPVQDLPLHSIPGGRMLYQLAAAELEGQHYALVSLGISNPFLFENLRSLLMHWGVSESLHSQWAQPPRGWHTSPGVSTPAGDRAWDTVFGAFAPVVGGDVVTDATVYSVVLQIPLEGYLEVKGGIKCVLRRTDHGQPEWIKAGHHNNGDFWLDFQPAINLFERKRRAAQEAALAQARATAAARNRRRSQSPAAGGGRKGKAKRKDWASLMSWDDADVEDVDWEVADEAMAAAVAASKQVLAAKQLHKKSPSPPPPAPVVEEEPPEVLQSAEIEDLPGWVEQVQRFEQLSDLPQEHTQAHHLRCLRHIAGAVQAGGGREGGALLQRCQEVEGMLQQVDLLELSSRAAQQEKEALQAMLKSAVDESNHLLHEIGNTAEKARRTAVRLRGRETEVTQRDLEAVAQQAAEELLKQHTGNGGSFWPFSKDEERQLVYVQQKVMEVAGVDALLVVQVFVEGSRAAVEAATAPPPPPASASSSEEEEEAEPEKRGRGRPKKKAPKKEKKEEEKPGFDHVVVGVAVAERFPDGHLTAPLIMHLGCVAHQAAKWQVPPEQWTCTPDAVSAHGAAAQVPFQRYSIAGEDGGPMFVDPHLYALALRLPLKDCMQYGVRGMEFVLKAGDGQWLSWEGHGNFYSDLPL